MNATDKAQLLRELADDAEVIEAARKAVEDELIEWRDDHRFMVCGNGFTVREQDSTPSPIIRFRTDIGLRFALRAMADHLAGEQS